MSCSHSNMALRHSAVVRGLERLLGQAGVYLQREQTRPADLFIRVGPNDGACAIDVTVVHPNILSAPSSTAISWAENRKRHRYEEQGSLVGVKLIPFVVTSYGSLGPEALRLLPLGWEVARRYVW